MAENIDNSKEAKRAAKAAKKDDSQVIKKFKYEGCPRWK